MHTIVNMMEQGIKDNIFPGAVLLVSVNSEILFHKSFGKSDLYTNQIMTKKTIFDLASLTKPLATAMAVLKLVQDGYFVSLDQTIGSVIDSKLNSSNFNVTAPVQKCTYVSKSPSSSDFISGFKDAHDLMYTFNSEKKAITLGELLRHTSGLPAHNDYYRQIIKYPQPLRRNCLKQLLLKEPLIHRPGEKEVYSDPGYILLAWIVEIISGQRIDHFLKNQVYHPLGIDDLFFIDLSDSVQKSDEDGERYIGKNFAATENCPWRKKLIKAEVHDDNAWAAGGIEGHAGLFGTAFAVWVLLSELMNGLQKKKTKIISGRVLRQFVRKNGKNDRVAGFDSPSRPVSSSGKYFSASSLGHLGFTGTSFWIDPEKSLIVILLTNRVHPSRKNIKIKKFRPLIHDLIMERFFYMKHL